MKDRERVEEIVSCKNCIHKVVCNFMHDIVHCEKKVKEKGCEHYQPELPKNSVVLSKEELEEKYEPNETFMAVARELEELKESLVDKIVIPKEEYEILTKDIEKPTDEVLKRLIVGKNLLIDKAVKKTIDETSKETAKKFYDRFNEKICYFTFERRSKEYSDGYAQAIADVCGRLDEVAKELGVNIKE